MIRFTWYELLWLFFIYSFLGWVLETAAATVKQKKFANRGLVNGPFCVIYGIAALFMTFGLQELRGVWLFLFAAIYATVIEWVAGHLIEKAFKARWWDYSKIRWNLDGYICIPASLVWGALGYLGIRWGNRFAIVVFKMLPLFLQITCCSSSIKTESLAVSGTALCPFSMLITFYVINPTDSLLDILHPSAGCIRFLQPAHQCI